MAQPPLLVLTEGLVERLPGIGELLEVGCSLLPRLRALTHELDGVAVAQRLERIAARFAYRALSAGDAGLPILRPRPNGVLDCRPEFCWSGVNCNAALTRSIRISVKELSSAALKGRGCTPAEGA